MRFAQSLACVAGLSLLATAGTALAAAKKIPEFAPQVAPAGILLEPLGKAQGYGQDKETATGTPREQIVYADARGLTLYTRDADPLGKSECVDECAKTWIPALVMRGAAPVATWSIITRVDGSKQWALKGKALYTYVKDEDPGSVGGNSPKRFGRGPLVGPRGMSSASIPKDVPLPEGWKVAYEYPASHEGLLAGFEVREVADALGLALVDRVGRTLYVGDPSTLKKIAFCAANCAWSPVAGPEVAEPIGDFGLVWREDGIRQWTYKGRPLFTSALDLAQDDANAVGVDKRYEVALVSQYFTPTNVSLQYNAKLGKIWATADGKTLYQRNSFIFQSGSGHSLRHGDAVRPAVGRDLGANPRCTVDCDKWHPLLAPADAMPSANWDVVARPDGKKQWVYSGYALWSYDGDAKPGDINGNDDYQLYMSHDKTTIVDIGTLYDGPTALYWIAAHP